LCGGTFMKTKIGLVLICILFVNSTMFSFPAYKPDNRKGTIKAVIRDANSNTPIEYANVTIHNSRDSSFVNGTVSDKKGELVFSNLAEGQYYLKISYIGYEKKYISNISITSAKDNI